MATDKIKIMGGAVSVTLTQEADSNSERAEQYLQVVVKDAGGGQYLVLQTEEWAIDKPDELVEMLNKILTQSKPLVEGSYGD